jgi:glycine betaine/choline ABC-type transport system substrate-binding protein
MIRRGRTLVAGVVVVSLLSAVVAGCGDDSGSGGAKPAVNIANKGFTESNIVTEAYKQALEGAGFTVTLKPLASTAIADAAIRNGDIDIYPDYTTTLLTDVLKVASPPTDVTEQVAAITSGYASRGLAVLDVAPFNNDNEVACTKDAVATYALTDLSSLGKASGNIVYSANPEHTTRADGLPLLTKEYGIKFKRVIKVDIGLRYRPVEQGQAQCVYAFGTDPKIAANGLVVLTDDKGKFQGAPYQGIPVVSQKFLDAAPPEFAETINKVSAALTSDEVRKMNASADLDKEDPDVVAKAVLDAKGLLAK